MRTLVLGDLHGGYKALLQCFDRSGFANGRDRLIFLGDAVDGWSQGPECVEELRGVRNLIYLLGNHDFWTMDWFINGAKPRMWISQGGLATMKAYRSRQWINIHSEHLKFMRKASLHFIDEENRLFVHGGIDPGLPLEKQQESTFIWDRRLFDSIDGVPGFEEVFIGHTPTIFADTTKPLNYGGNDNIWRMDTGAGWYGKLSIMDVETKEYWQSDVVRELYPDERGRMSGP